MIKAIAIDLDDTLLNTTGLLASKASNDAFSYLIKNGLKLTLAECESLRVDLIRSISHREVFERLTKQYGNKQTEEALTAATLMFYEPSLPNKLPLMDGAEENLRYLQKKYPLFIVTAGTKSAQLAKIEALNIQHFFKKTFIVNSLIKERKREVFLKIISEENIQPKELLCFGNSISSEMKDAMEVGASTCYFEFGENRGSFSDLPHAPDFHIQHHSEFITTCKL